MSASQPKQPKGNAGHSGKGDFPARVNGPELPPAWLLYRDGFAIMQHLYSLTDGEAAVGVPWPWLMAQLGYLPAQAQGLIDYLVVTGCVEYHPGRREIALTPAGVEYMEWQRGRRCSIRPEAA